MQISILIPNLTVRLIRFGIFWLGGLYFWWDFKIVGHFLVASFCKPEIGICISLLVSKIVLLVEFHEVGCCMACVSLLALTELNDGMFAISAQCGGCHHLDMNIDIYALLIFCSPKLFGIFLVPLFAVCICSFGILYPFYM